MLSRPPQDDRGQNRSNPQERGFLLLGLSIALFALAIAATFAVPAWQRSQRVTRARDTLAALNAFAVQFQSYARDNGDWPVASTLPGEFPPGMEHLLATSPWRHSAPIGGRYVWLADSMQRGERIRAAIAITTVSGNPVSDDRRQLDELLRQAKEAGAAAVRLGFRNEPIYVLEH